MPGLRTALRLVWRNNWRWWIAWIVGLAALHPATASAYREIMGAGPQAASLAQTLANNPTMRALLGPPYDLLTAGGFTMWRVGGFAATLSGIMAVIGVVRSTRGDEELGRWELLRSGEMDRHAPLAATMLVALAACAGLAGLITVSMIAVDTPASGAVAMGAAIGATAAFFVGVGALAAQLTTTARAAKALGLGVLAAAYGLRMSIDGQLDPKAEWLRWLSPVEWAPLVRPYADERWWVLCLPVGGAAVLAAVAWAIEGRRDHQAGVLRDRGGAETAHHLGSPWVLAWRLNRGPILGWTLGMAAFGGIVGSLSDSLASIADNPLIAARLRAMGAGAGLLTDAFVIAMFNVMVVLAATSAVQIFSTLRREESSGRLELALSGTRSRTTWLAAFGTVAVVSPALALLAGAALVGQLVSSDAGAWLVAMLTLTPTLVVVVGVACAVVGLAPRWAGGQWLMVGWLFFIDWLAPVLGLPDALLEWSPLRLLPHLPVEEFEWLPVLGVLAVGVAGALLGLIGWRRRDIG